MRESDWWRYLKGKLVNGLYYRLESPTSPGMPDVIGQVAFPDEEGRTVLVELKALTQSSAALGMTPVQVRWHKRWAVLGGSSWLLARVGGDVVLARGVDVGDGVRGRAVLDRKLADVDWEKVEWSFCTGLSPT